MKFDQKMGLVLQAVKGYSRKYWYWVEEGGTNNSSYMGGGVYDAC